MFDVKHETNIKERSTVPDAATKEPPVRIEVNGEVCWMRPSNVLRIEFKPANMGLPDLVVVTFSDGKEKSYKGTVNTADNIAVLLWPSK